MPPGGNLSNWLASPSPLTSGSGDYFLQHLADVWQGVLPDTARCGFAAVHHCCLITEMAAGFATFGIVPSAARFWYDTLYAHPYLQENTDVGEFSAPPQNTTNFAFLKVRFNDSSRKDSCPLQVSVLFVHVSNQVPLISLPPNPVLCRDTFRLGGFYSFEVVSGLFILSLARRVACDEHGVRNVRLRKTVPTLWLLGSKEATSAGMGS